MGARVGGDSGDVLSTEWRRAWLCTGERWYWSNVGEEEACSNAVEGSKGAT